MEKKICPHCKKKKNRDCFKSYANRTTGRITSSAYCKECDRVLTIQRQLKSYNKYHDARTNYQKEWRKKNQDLHNEGQRRRYHARKAKKLIAGKSYA